MSHIAERRTSPREGEGFGPRLLCLTFALWLVTCGFALRAHAADPIVLSPQEGVKQGKELAEQMRSMEPSKLTGGTGVLNIKRPRTAATTVPIRFELRPSSGGPWTKTYEAPRLASGISKVVVAHEEGRTNLYTVVENGVERSLGGNEAMVPFAGSDFWLADLGLEFLAWPEQRILRKEIRRGQSCSVLQSTNPNPARGGYSRVLSWVDIDTGGIINADAYDSAGKLMKAFAAKSFKKIRGEWELKEIEMYDRRTRSMTTLTFDLAAGR